MDAIYTTKLKTILKQHGFSITTSRLAVFEALYMYGLQTVAQLIERCHTVDRASIYRTISLFEALGIIVRVNLGFKYKLELSDNFLPHHHHITCTRCGVIVDIEQSRLESLLEQIATANDFALTSHRVELGGLCRTCQQMILD